MARTASVLCPCYFIHIRSVATQINQRPYPIVPAPVGTMQKTSPEQKICVSLTAAFLAGIPSPFCRGQRRGSCEHPLTARLMEGMRNHTPKNQHQDLFSISLADTTPAHETDSFAHSKEYSTLARTCPQACNFCFKDPTVYRHYNFCSVNDMDICHTDVADKCGFFLPQSGKDLS